MGRWASTVGSSVATWPSPPGSSSLSGRSGSNFAEETHRLQNHRTQKCSTNNSNFIVQPGTTKTSVTNQTSQYLSCVQPGANVFCMFHQHNKKPQIYSHKKSKSKIFTTEPTLKIGCEILRGPTKGSAHVLKVKFMQ